MKRAILVTVALVAVVTFTYYVLDSYFDSREGTQKTQMVSLPKEPVVVTIYFSNNQKDPQSLECNKVYPVERKISKTGATARATLEELLKGPTQMEKDQGYFTNINTGVKIQSLNVESDITKVTFNGQLEYQVGGSCRVQAIRAQIVGTLRLFSGGQRVVISINGRTEDILQP